VGVTRQILDEDDPAGHLAGSQAFPAARDEGALNPGSLVTGQIGIEAVNDTLQALDRFDTLGCHVITSF
jgi:hypothetical protein